MENSNQQRNDTNRSRIVPVIARAVRYLQMLWWRPKAVYVGEAPQPQTWPFYGQWERCRCTAMMHAQFWPYDDKAQEYQTTIQKLIAGRREYIRRHQQAVASLEEDVTALTQCLLSLPADLDSPLAEAKQ